MFTLHAAEGVQALHILEDVVRAVMLAHDVCYNPSLGWASLVHVVKLIRVFLILLILLIEQ